MCIMESFLEKIHYIRAVYFTGPIQRLKIVSKYFSNILTYRDFLCDF